MKAAVCSCLTWIYFKPSFLRMASTIPKEEVPGIPKTYSIPQLTICSARTSDTVVSSSLNFTSSLTSNIKALKGELHTGHLQFAGSSSNL